MRFARCCHDNASRQASAFFEAQPPGYKKIATGARIDPLGPYRK
jgi:hypothetical protein